MARTEYIYKNPTFAGCSNKGISDTFDEVIVVGADEVSDAPNAVRIIRRTIGNRVVFHAEPVNGKAGTVGAMSGGSFISVNSITARLYPEFSQELTDFYGLISLHDRYETQAEYNTFSN